MTNIAETIYGNYENGYLVFIEERVKMCSRCLNKMKELLNEYTPEIEPMRAINEIIASLTNEFNQYVSDYQKYKKLLTNLSVREIEENLDAIKREFGEFYWDNTDKLSIQTHVILEGIDFGYPELSLFTSSLSILVEAEPGFPQHPHVSNVGGLCLGDGFEVATKHLLNANLYDFFIVAERILQNYNPNTAYYRIGELECHECGIKHNNDEGICCICGNSFCINCIYWCLTCEKPVCGDHSISCLNCDILTCENCECACKDNGKPS